MGSFVRRVKTASGATAVQIVHKRGRTVLGIDHVGSAHDAGQLAVLLETAQARLVYASLGFAQIADNAFKALVLARIIEPTSKADTVRVLADLGVPGPSRVTFMRCLKRVIARDYRTVIATACYAHAARDGGLALVLYDLTTLHFETDVEDRLRKVGMSKERRVDPQVTLGLLTTSTGFPLDVHLFEGNKAETKTLIPVLTAFRDRHQIADVVVVADAGMLSAANLRALEDAGYRFIVGSKTTSAADDLADHLKRHGNAFTNGQTIETTRTMGTGKDARERRVVYEYSFKRSQHDNRAINKMIERAEAVAAGSRPLKKDRFVTIADATKSVNWALVERARYLAGLKGYVTNIGTDTMDGLHIVTAYHDLYEVERSFRMTKSDLAARPIYHRIRDSIEAHLTVVFAALAVSREAQARTGVSIKKIVQTLRPLRSATISVGQQQLTAPPRIPDPARAILSDLAKGGH